MLDYIVTSLTGENSIKIIIFLYVFSGLINLIKISGGIKGFVEVACTLFPLLLVQCLPGDIFTSPFSDTTVTVAKILDLPVLK
ncbi:hypothetical protein [Effusibacillus consociatus]|uniref:Uncharacterized protein n=1 Tax=Effusibacillus consociatus TaxID=1117041 RepID=A0ABV9Q9H2_9BACL